MSVRHTRRKKKVSTAPSLARRALRKQRRKDRVAQKQWDERRDVEPQPVKGKEPVTGNKDSK